MFSKCFLVIEICIVSVNQIYIKIHTFFYYGETAAITFVASGRPQQLSSTVDVLAINRQQLMAALLGLPQPQAPQPLDRRGQR